MKRIGLLGGTFNPIHIGHLAMGQAALEQMNLNKVIFIPSHTPPHKHVRNLPEARQRYNMVRLATQGHAKFEISDFEIKRAGKSYSIETIRYFIKKYPKGTKFFFIVGADTFRGLKKWKQVDDVLKLVSFIVVNRPGAKPQRKGVRFYSVSMPDMDIASSFLRTSIRRGQSVKYLVPDNVLQYIKRGQLYLRT